TKKADFIVMYRASNDEIAEQAATKVGVKLSRVFMKDTGLDIYGTGLIVKDDDVKKRPEFVRAYVEATLEGLRYARDHQEESLKILLQHKPELESVLTTLQLKNALTEVYLPPESANLAIGYMKPEIMDKTVKVVNDYFDVGRKVASKEVYTNQFIRRYRKHASQGFPVPPLISVSDVSRVFASAGKTVAALEHVGFDIQAGNFVSIVGPSGCGK